MERAVVFLTGLLLLTALATGVVWCGGSRNPATEAGYVGYVTQGAVIGEVKFLGMQTGPVSPGRTWMAHVINVSITPYSYEEKFDINDGTSAVSRDSLRIQASVHVLWRIKPEQEAVRKFVEHYSTLHEGDAPDAVAKTAYDHYIKGQVRALVKAAVAKYDGIDLPVEVTTLGNEVLLATRKAVGDAPFEIIQVALDNLTFPKEVADAISAKIAARQEYERKGMEIETTKREAIRKMEDAKGVANAMREINKTLSPEYLQYLAIEAQKVVALGPNHTTVYIPSGPMGVPMTGTFPVSK